jgi:hypothetical protein
MKGQYKNIYVEGSYLEENPTWHVEDSSWKAKHIMKIIEKNNINFASICDVGCGAGEILNQLYIKMPENILFCGYEISPQAFEFCKRKEKDRLKYKLENFLEDDKTFFDIVLVIDVIEHVEDYFYFLRKLRNKGYYKIFHIPLDLSAQEVFRSLPLLRKRKKVGHIHYFTKEIALEVLKDTGYIIIDYFYTSATIDLPAKSLLSLLAKIPRKFIYKLNKDMAARILGGFSLMVLGK